MSLYKRKKKKQHQPPLRLSLIGLASLNRLSWVAKESQGHSSLDLPSSCHLNQNFYVCRDQMCIPVLTKQGFHQLSQPRPPIHCSPTSPLTRQEQSPLAHADFKLPKLPLQILLLPEFWNYSYTQP